MKTKKVFYSITCLIGALTIGFFANQLNTLLGSLMFTMGCIIMIISIIKLSK